jgi:predicted dehydrogenase
MSHAAEERMKLGSLKEGGRDGTLVVVDRNLQRAVRADGIAATLQQALDDWSNAAPRLNALYQALQEGRTTVEGAATFADGYRIQLVLDAARRADESGCWAEVERKY